MKNKLKIKLNSLRKYSKKFYTSEIGGEEVKGELIIDTEVGFPFMRTYNGGGSFRGDFPVSIGDLMNLTWKNTYRTYVYAGS